MHGTTVCVEFGRCITSSGKVRDHGDRRVRQRRRRPHEGFASVILAFRRNKTQSKRQCERADDQLSMNPYQMFLNAVALLMICRLTRTGSAGMAADG